MKKFFRTESFFIGLVLVFSLILFKDGFVTYFYQDDFNHFFHSQTVEQVTNAFNIFKHAEYPYYRPLSTQVYFFLLRGVFGYYPLGYHIVNFIIYTLNTFLVFYFIRYLTKDMLLAKFSTIFFAINATHIAPLFSAANVQELLYVFFGISSVFFFTIWIHGRKTVHYLFATLAFVGALMSKETAVVLPGILVLIVIYLKGWKSMKHYIVFAIPVISILAVYLVGHFKFYGFAQSSSYAFSISKKNINILIWYGLWALSTPNFLIDFFGPGIRINPTFFKVSGISGTIYLILFPLFSIGVISKIIMLMFKRSLGNLKLCGMGILWFIVGMIPLIAFPWHALATEQAFSTIGLALLLSVVSVYIYRQGKMGKIFCGFLIGIYICMVANTIILAKRTHWVIQSAQKARNVIQYVDKNYPKLNGVNIIYFTNGVVKIPEFGSSRQIYYALGNGRGLALLYSKPGLQVYFEDIQKPKEDILKGSGVITLDSSQFLGY